MKVRKNDPGQGLPFGPGKNKGNENPPEDRGESGGFLWMRKSAQNVFRILGIWKEQIPVGSPTSLMASGNDRQADGPVRRIKE
jgi:hypothetical protein